MVCCGVGVWGVGGGVVGVVVLVASQQHLPRDRALEDCVASFQTSRQNMASALALVLAVVQVDAFAIGRGLKHHTARVQYSPAMHTFFDDDGVDRFSDEDLQRMAERLNGMMGVPQAEPIAAGRVDSRNTGECGIPFIDTHFPSRHAQLEAMREASAHLQSRMDQPRVEVEINEDAYGYAVTMIYPGADVSDQLGITLEDGVLMVVLSALGEDSDTITSAQILVPVPLPTDAGNEIMTVAYGAETVTVRVSKDARAAKELDGDIAHVEHQGKDALHRVAQFLRAFGLDVEVDEDGMGL